MDDFRVCVKDAVVCHFDEGAAPKTIRLHFVRDEVLSVSGCPETFPGATSSAP